MISRFFKSTFLLVAFFVSALQLALAQAPGTPDAKKTPIHFAIALAQPEEAKTIAWLNAAPLWEGESFSGYGFGE
jgi:hypothetical protein